jgi:hypothetical protein
MFYLLVEKSFGYEKTSAWPKDYEHGRGSLGNARQAKGRYPDYKHL